MSFSGVGGGFQGGDALLAFAAIQQGRMNEEMTESMRVADLRSQMAGDLADIKAHLDQADKHPEKFLEVNDELKAFMAKYGAEPALEDVTSTVADIAKVIDAKCEAAGKSHYMKEAGSGSSSTLTSAASDAAKALLAEDSSGSGASNYDLAKQAAAADFFRTSALGFAEGSVETWIDQITQKLDSSGTNDQLSMIHIKQLNDNINNSSSMVSGIIESRNNATSSIINNIA